MKNKIHLAVLGALFLLFSGYSHAQAPAEQDNIQILESLGTIKTGDSRHTGTGMYHKTSRKTLNLLIGNIGHSSWIASDQLVNNALLSASDTTGIIEDDDSENKTNLLENKFKTLLHRGLYKQAHELYEIIPEGNTAGLEYYGVLSMLLSGEKGKACLEVKTVYPEHKTSLFWHKMNCFCEKKTFEYTESPELVDVLNKIVSDENFKIPYFLADFAKIPLEDKALLTASNAIDISSLAKSELAQIPPEDLQPILSQDNISDPKLLLLNAHALEKNLISAFEFTKLYKELKEKYKSEKTNPDGAAEIVNLYDSLSFFTQIDTNKEFVVKTFNISGQYTDTLILPLLPTFFKLDLDTYLNAEHVERILKVILYTHYPVPDDWLSDVITPSSPDKHSLEERQKLAFVITLMKNDINEKLLNKAKEFYTPYLERSVFAADINNIIENIDRTDNNSDKVAIVYEKAFDSMKNRGYTLPPIVLTDALAESSKSKNIAGTIFLSGRILGSINQSQMYSGTLAEITKALYETGFANQARNILAQAILENEDN